jgi:arylsulfatase A-like enzyme
MRARSLDQGVGMVLNQLDACGLQDETLIIFTTDHGMPFPGAKATLYDRGLGVMLILRGLYDVFFDPNEANNLVDDPEQAAVLADLKGRLDRWMRDTDDPLLAGHVDAPPGVEINLPYQRSASYPTTRADHERDRRSVPEREPAPHRHDANGRQKVE